MLFKCLKCLKWFYDIKKSKKFLCQNCRPKTTIDINKKPDYISKSKRNQGHAFIFNKISGI